MRTHESRRPGAARSLLGALAVATAAATLGGIPQATAATQSVASAVQQPSAAHPFDAEGHRGARGLRPENTLPAFDEALRTGVTTLEMDTAITKDGRVVVTHELVVTPQLCQDIAPAFPGDPAFPYVGKNIRDLTLAEVKTLDCGTRRPADPVKDEFVRTQQPVPGTRVPTLDEVYALAEQRCVTSVRFDVETKIDPTRSAQTPGPEEFTDRVTDVIRRHRAVHRTTLQSFDWRTLWIAEDRVPQLRRSALFDASTAELGKPGPSPWLAGADADDFRGDLAAAARAAVRAQLLAPDASLVTPQLVTSSHARGMGVLPWTPEDPAQMHRLIDTGVDGIITDYPDRLRQVMADRRMPLPTASPAP